MQLRPGNCSIVASLGGTSGATRVDARPARRQRSPGPINIYELHPGSWRRDYDRHAAGPQLARAGRRSDPWLLDLATRTSAHGLPTPLRRLLGYQVVGYFAPTARSARRRSYALRRPLPPAGSA